jgi:hypothetical protein
MLDGQTDINIIPEYPISKTLFLGNHSIGGIVDFLKAKIPGQYTHKMLNYHLIQVINMSFRLFT